MWLFKYLYHVAACTHPGTYVDHVHKVVYYLVKKLATFQIQHYVYCYFERGGGVLLLMGGKCESKI